MNYGEFIHSNLTKVSGLKEGMESISIFSSLWNTDLIAVPLLETIVATVILAMSLPCCALLYWSRSKGDIIVASFALCLENTIRDG